MNIAVVGCNRGIGFELARLLGKEGHDVYGFCRKASPELRELNLSAVVEEFEVTENKSMSEKLSQLKDVKFDWLIHVSGILKSEALESFNEDTILEQFKVNSLGPVLSVQAFRPYLAASSKVGLLTSRMGSIADNTSGGMYGYRMSKAALNMAGKSLAYDLKDDGVTVLLLHPGYVKTDMTNNNGNISAEESAKGLIEILKTKDQSHTGSFWHMNQEELPW